MTKVLFVCLGNICRSPMAEAIFQQLVEDAGLGDQFYIDSAGTGDWHVGEPAHVGTRRVLADNGIVYNGRSRQITRRDTQDPNTYIIVMDSSNMETVKKRFGDHPRIYRLLDFASQSTLKDVPDPYYTGGFDEVYRLVKDGCEGLLAELTK